MDEDLQGHPGMSSGSRRRTKFDLGRFSMCELDEAQGAFKTPSLREVSSTATYIHDRRYGTIEEVV